MMLDGGSDFTGRHMLWSFVQNEKLLHLKTLSMAKDVWAECLLKTGIPENLLPVASFLALSVKRAELAMV